MMIKFENGKNFQLHSGTHNIVISPSPPFSLSPCSIKVVVDVVVVSVAMVVGSEVTLVALVMTPGDLARDLTRVEMADSPTEGEGRRRKHGTKKYHLSQYFQTPESTKIKTT